MEGHSVHAVSLERECRLGWTKHHLAAAVPKSAFGWRYLRTICATPKPLRSLNPHCSVETAANDVTALLLWIFASPPFLIDAVGRRTYHQSEWKLEFLLGDINRKTFQSVFDHFSYEILKPYWSDRNWFLVDGYPGLKLPYTKLETPSVFLEVEWNFEQVKGYLKSWSAYQKFIDENHQDPFMRIEQDLKTIWGSPETKHSFKWDIHWLTSIK